MAGGGGPFLEMVEIVGEFGTGLLLALDDARAQHRTVLHIGTQPAHQFGIFRNTLGDDVARAFKRRLHICDLFGEIGGGEICRHGGAIGENGFGQGAQAALAGDLGLRAALGLIGQVDVFELGLGGRDGDASLELGGQFALFADGFENGLAPALKLAQIAQPLGQETQLRIVERAGDFLAVARDERHRRALVEQRNGGDGLLRAGADVLGNQNRDIGLGGFHEVLAESVVSIEAT